MNDITTKKCVPCEGGMPPMSKEKAQELLAQVPDWNIDKANKKISRDFTLKNFKKAVAFVNKVADIAESEGHHPDIFIHEWNKVLFELTTHAIGGLSENDFIIAAKINGAWSAETALTRS